MMNTLSLSLVLALISCCILSVYSKDCDDDNDCHYGRCCESHCIWHHFCPCVNDNDCRSGEKCSGVHGYRYCKKTDHDPTPKTYTTKFWQDHDTDPPSKTETFLKKSETHKRAANSWRTGSKIIVISCLVAVVALVPFIYFLFKKTRKRPTNVTVLSPQATQTGMTRVAMNPLVTADLQMQQGNAACNGATAMEAGAGPCPFKPPGALPPYHALEFEGKEKGNVEPPPCYDDAVKPAVVTTK